MFVIRILGTEVFAIGIQASESDAETPTVTSVLSHTGSTEERADGPYSTDFAEEYPLYEDATRLGFGFHI